METACHRCGNPVREGDGFCAHCGAPQLTVEAADAAVQQQQQTVHFRGEPQRVNWRTAILSALLVAIPVGLLSAFTNISALFVIAGGFVTLALYRRRSAGSSTDGRIGWRVGAILGAASAAVACAADATRLLADRYLFHEGKAIDADFSAMAQQIADAILKTNPEALPRTQVIHVWTGFWLSPDGHAAIRLLTAFMVSLGMTLFAATGGAIAGRLLSLRAREQRSL